MVEKEIITGVVTSVFPEEEGKNPHSYRIFSEDTFQIYFFHIGDSALNEIKLYSDSSTPTEYFKRGDKVKFHHFIPTDLLAINVKKIEEKDED